MGGLKKQNKKTVVIGTNCIYVSPPLTGDCAPHSVRNIWFLSKCTKITKVSLQHFGQPVFTTPLWRHLPRYVLRHNAEPHSVLLDDLFPPLPHWTRPCSRPCLVQQAVRTRSAPSKMGSLEGALRMCVCPFYIYIYIIFDYCSCLYRGRTDVWSVIEVVEITMSWFWNVKTSQGLCSFLYFTSEKEWDLFLLKGHKRSSTV